MTDLFLEEEFVYPNERKNTDPTRIVGNTWSAWKINANFVLEYISGELAGRIKRISITETEYQKLVEKKISVEQVLGAHGSF